MSTRDLGLTIYLFGVLQTGFSRWSAFRSDYKPSARSHWQLWAPSYGQFINIAKKISILLPLLYSVLWNGEQVSNKTSTCCATFAAESPYVVGIGKKKTLYDTKLNPLMTLRIFIWKKHEDCMVLSSAKKK